MASRYSYYVLTAANGGMIADSWEQACACAEYLRRGRKVIGVDDWDSAKQMLWDHLNDVVPYWCHIPERFRLGKIYTVNALIKKNHLKTD